MQAMMRYKLKRDQVEEHLGLLRAVYEELESIQPDGLRWATFQLEDELSFVDFVVGADLPQPLPQLETFRRYRAELDERCDEVPVFSELTEVGSFRFT